MLLTQSASKRLLLPLVMGSFLLSNSPVLSWGFDDVKQYAIKPLQYVQSIDPTKRNRALLALVVTYTLLEMKLIMKGTKENFVPRYENFKPKSTGDYFTLLKYYWDDAFIGQRLKDIPVHIKDEQGNYKVDALFIQPVGFLGKVDGYVQVATKALIPVTTVLALAYYLCDPIDKTNRGWTNILQLLGINLNQTP